MTTMTTSGDMSPEDAVRQAMASKPEELVMSPPPVSPEEGPGERPAQADSVAAGAARGDEAALIAAAVAGRSLKEIAAAAGVSVSTVKRRMSQPDFADLIREGRAEQQRQAVGRLNDDLAVVIDRLHELAAHEDPKIALSAIDKLLANVHRFAKSEAPSSEEA